MKIKFVFDAQFCGRAEMLGEMPEGSSDAQIKTAFEKALGIPYDDNCYYEVVKDENL